jgi:hypothetical protein
MKVSGRAQLYRSATGCESQIVASDFQFLDQRLACVDMNLLQGGTKDTSIRFLRSVTAPDVGN